MRYISSNVTHMGGEMTQAEFDGWLRKGFRFGSNKKLLMAAGNVINIINGWAREKVAPAQFNPSYGLRLAQYVTPFGDVDIAYAPLLENDSLDDLTGLAGTGILLDVPNLEIHHLPNSYMVHKTGIQDNDEDGESEQILSECCLKMPQEKMHGYFDGATS